MTTKQVARILERDLETLRRELMAYPQPDLIWETPAGISNSAGNLALHLVGNLQHFIGAQLGNSGYIRDRAAEFSSRNAPLETLLNEIERTKAAVHSALAGLTPNDLDKTYPLAIAGVSVKTGDWLLHSLTHFCYHLGQIDYHRRMVTGQKISVGAQAIPELLSAQQTP